MGSHCPANPLQELEGFDAAVAYLEQSSSTGSFVVVWPPEQASALQRLPVSLRAADAVPFEKTDRRQYSRIAVIGPAGFCTPPELGAALAEPRKRFHEVEIGTFLWETDDRVVFDLRADLGQVRLLLEGTGTTLECDKRRPDGGWSCPGRPPWNHVAPTSLTVEGQNWPAVWAHPVAQHQLIIDLGERELADHIEVSAALADAAVSTPNGATVQVLLEVDGMGKQTLNRINSRGIASMAMPTQPGTKAKVRLTVSALRDGRRHLGINLRIVEKRTP